MNPGGLMTRKILCLFAGCMLAALVIGPFRAGARDDSTPSKLIGKWTNQNETKGPAIINVTALSLLTFVSFISTSLSQAHNSHAQNGTTTTAQSAPTEKTVEQVFKNIKVLNGMPQSQLYPTMRFMAASLGFQCGSCHVIKNGFVDASADDKSEKQTAREMIKLVIEINKTMGQGNPT